MMSIMTTETITVARITLAEPVQVSESFESAAQYRTVEIPAGEHEIQVRPSRYGGHYLAVVANGTVVASGYGGKRYDDEIGTEREFVRQSYKYEIRDAIVSGRLPFGRPLNEQGFRCVEAAVVGDLAAFEDAVARVRGV